MEQWHFKHGGPDWVTLVRWCVRCVGPLLCYACCSAALAQSDYELTVEPVFGRVYTAGQWIPLRIDIRNNTDSPIHGAVVIPVVQPPSAVKFRVPVAVPGRSRVIRTAYGYLPVKPPTQTTAGTSAAAVAIAELEGADGARLTRSEILAQPDSGAISESGEPFGIPGLLLLSVSDEPESRDVHAAAGIAELLAAEVPYPISIGSVKRQALPRHLAGYESVRAVIFNGVFADSLDHMQRAVLRQYLLAGGILVLPAPLDENDPTGTWLGPYLPVQIIGSRVADRIESPDEESRPLKLREAVEICEATEGDGQVLLQDGEYVHAASRQIGLGRVIFTSFPVDALDHDHPQTSVLWQRLLDLHAARDDWPRAHPEKRDHLLEAMIGAPAAPWIHAAAIGGGYVLLIIMSQLLLPGARRPVAFAVGSVVAVAACAVLMGVTALRGGDPSLSAARLATVQLGEGGGGVRHEVLAFLGPDDSGFAVSADVSAALRPVVGSPDAPPTLEQLPFSAPGAGVRSGRINHVWQVSSTISPDRALSATAQFTPEGVRIELENQTGHELLAPLLLWKGRAYRMAPVPVGRSDATLGAKNPAGDFTNPLVFTGEEAGLRGRFIQLAVMGDAEVAASSAAQMSPVLVGWLDSMESGISGPIIRSSSPVSRMRSLVLLQTPLRIVPSTAGAVVRIPPEFMVIRSGDGGGAIYDAERDDWLQSLQVGTWHFGFEPPAQIGKYTPLRASISVDVLAPEHIIILQRGQCLAGSVTDNAEGPLVAQWNRVAGSRTVSVDLDPDDVDSNGRLWLRLSVEDAGGAGLLPQWKFNDLSVSVEVQMQAETKPEH